MLDLNNFDRFDRSVQNQMDRVNAQFNLMFYVCLALIAVAFVVVIVSCGTAGFVAGHFLKKIW